MNAQAWIALGALAVMVLGTAITGVAHAIKTAYTFGQHAQRMASAEDDIKKLQETQEEHSKAISTWEQALMLLKEVREDVKALMIGRAPRRRAGEG